MKAPNFFIVGAPKAGTTALNYYLADHPHVFMCEPKEPHYFAHDFAAHQQVDSWDDYMRLFARAGAGHGAVGEASVFYLRSSLAIPAVLDRIPHARFIVLLRNPVDLVRSMHAQALYCRDENVVSFEDAWSLLETRRRGLKIPRSCRDVKVLLYDELAMLGEQLSRLLQHVPRQQVRWWFLEDVASKPGAVYREVLEFLDVPHDGRTTFPRVNVRKRARSQLLAHLTQKPPRHLVQAGLRVKRLFGIDRLGLLERLRSVNTLQASAGPLRDDFEMEVRSCFAQDIERLEVITGRSLDGWR